MNSPLTYSEQSYIDFFNRQPSVVKGVSNDATQFYKRILYNDIYASLSFNIPKDWKMNWFRFWLFHYGSIAVIYTKRYGWIINPYSITELNYQYNPKKIKVVNAYLKGSFIGVIGVNSGIIHLFDDYYGVDKIVTYFAEKMANCDSGINANIMNSKLAYIFYAENKKQADEMKEVYSKVSTGEPLVTYHREGKDVSNDRVFTPFFNNINSNFIADKLIDAQHTIRNHFLTIIGIPNANTDKKERLITNEVNSNNVETQLLLDVMIENIQSSMDEINAISDLNLSVEKRYKGGEINVENNTLGLLPMG